MQKERLGLINRHKFSVFIAISVAFLSNVISAKAQFLRLGPFDFEAQTRVEAIYTTNVEQERPSEATADRNDYYLVWALDLVSDKQISSRTRLSLDTGIAIEKHFNRTDLDNSEAPFGRFGARFESDWDPLKFYGGARWERTSESVDEIFVPTGLPRKGRQVGTTEEYTLGTDFTSKYLLLGASYEFIADRFDEDQFADAETDEQTVTYFAEVIPNQYMSVRYQNENTKTDFINLSDGEGDWLTDEEITINLDISELLWERPQVTYSLGVQREEELSNQGDEDNGWELIHRLAISDKFELSPTLRWDYLITYEYEQDPEEDDLTLTYGINIEHDISKRASHRFSATREPVQTLGSTTDTDETEYRYSFTTRDFGHPNVNFNAAVGYVISDPLEGETENILDYLVGLSHAVPVTSRITREIRYEYTWEDSNLEAEILDEHRLSLIFRYDL